ncbi:MAG: hypothetical protein LQ348_003785, partial [Seirophora lacunosa]
MSVPPKAIPSSIKRFASRIVDVYVGDERFHYPAHEAFLFQSKELKSQYDVQNRGKKNNKKKENILNLPRDTPNEFGQLLEYLYLNKFTLRASEPQAQAEELLGIWTAGTRHSLIGMQKHVIRKLEELDIAGKLPVLAFLRLADKLYESEVDNGLRRYFSTVATDVVSKITAADMPVLLEMIIEGGSFASDLFHAHHKAFGPGKSAAATEQGSTIATAAIKTEDSQPQRTAKRARTENIAGTVPNLPRLPPTIEKSSSTNPPAPDVRTEWDIANSIPVALEAATVEDKLLVRWADDRKPWCDIALAWENHTSERVSIKELQHRYERIDANILRLGNRDADLLHLARTAIETAFKTSKWPLIAARIVEDGGTRIPHLQLQRYCDALDAKAAEQEATRHANEVAAAAAATTAAASAAGGKGSQLQPLRPHHHLAARRLALTEEPHIPTEVVGGVRVENSKPLGVVRRKRWVPGPKNAPVADTAKRSSVAKKTKGKANTINTANTANGGGTPEVEDSGDTD